MFNQQQTEVDTYAKGLRHTAEVERNKQVLLFGSCLVSTAFLRASELYTATLQQVQLESLAAWNSHMGRATA